MAEPLDELVIKLTANVEGLQAQFARVSDIITKSGDTIGNKFSGAVTAGVLKAEIAFHALTKAAEGLWHMTVGLVERQAEYIDSTAKLADRMGITTEEMQTLAFVANQTDTSMSSLTVAVRNMNKALEDSKDKSSEAYQAMVALHLETTDFTKLDAAESIGVIADALNSYTGSIKTSVLQGEIFGARNGEIFNLLKHGSQYIRDAAAEMTALGLSFTRADASKVEAMNDELKKLKLITDGIGNRLAIASAPFITAIARELVDASKNAGAFQKQIDEVVKDVLHFAAFVGDTIHGLGIEWDYVKVGFGHFMVAVNEGLSFLVEGFGTLKNVLNNLQIVFMNAGTSIKDEFGLAWLYIQKAFSETVGYIEGLLASLLQKFADALAAVGSDMTASVQTMASQMQLASATAGNSIDKDIKQKSDEAKKSTDALAQSMQDFLNNKQTTTTSNPYKAAIEEATKLLADWQVDLKNALSAPLPSVAIEAWLAKVLEAADKAAQAMADAMNKGAGGKGADSDEVKAEREKNAALVNEKLSYYETNKLAEDEDYEKRLAAQREQFEKAGTTKAEQDAIFEQMAAEHQQRLHEFEQTQDKNQLGWNQFTAKQKVDVWRGVNADIMTLAQGHSKKMFEISKSVALADAIISTAAGVALTFKQLGWYALFGPAEAVAAAGAVQIQAIASTQFNSGGGSRGGGTSAGGGAPPARDFQGGGGGGGTQNVTIALQGTSFSQDDVRGLIEKINAAVGDGAKLKVA